MIWKIWVLDTCYKLLNTDTWLVLASCRVTQYSGKVDLTEYLFCNSNTRYVFSIQQRYLWTISPLSSYLDTRFVYIQHTLLNGFSLAFFGTSIRLFFISREERTELKLVHNNSMIKHINCLFKAGQNICLVPLTTL